MLHQVCDRIMKKIFFSILILLLTFLSVHAVITDPVLYLNFNQSTGNIYNATGGMNWAVPTGVQQAQGGVTNGAYGFYYAANGSPTSPLHITNATWNSIDNTAFTWVIFFVRNTSLGAASTGFMGKGGNLSSNGLLLETVKTNDNRFEINAGSNFSGSGLANGPTLGTWVCAVIVYNITDFKAHAFGNQSTTDNEVINVNIDQSDPFDLLLGGTDNTTRPTGNITIDQFAMYNRILTVTEWQAVCGNWSSHTDFVATVLPVPPSISADDLAFSRSINIVLFLLITGVLFFVLAEFSLHEEIKWLMYGLAALFLLGTIIAVLLA